MCFRGGCGGKMNCMLWRGGGGGGGGGQATTRVEVKTTSRQLQPQA